MAASIIDPNDAISSQSLVNLGLNATPDYSDMFIYAELTAQRRTASILSTGGVGKPTTLDTANEAVKINLMGFDQNTGQYTTRWTENIGSGVTPYEGFGMTSINLKTNSSYVPTVDIEFVDIRGLSLISLGVNSPYSVLYSFPPPIFKLTIKGYYGKAIEYDLHLVRQSTRFDADSGNYFINVNFIARRYAPLTDVLFKYIDIFPLMNENISTSSPDTKGMDFSLDTAPRNTRELLLKAMRLYDDIDKTKANSPEAKSLDASIEYIGIGKEIINSLNSFSDILKSKNSTNTDSIGLYTFKKTTGSNIKNGIENNTDDSSQATKIKNVQEFDPIIYANSPDGIDASKLTDRLCILYEYDNSINLSSNVAKTTSLDEDFNFLIDKFLFSIKKIDTNIKKSSIDYRNVKNSLKSSNGKSYIGVDITDYYVRLKKDITAKQIDYDSQKQKLISKINDISTKTLGFRPTIRNIFSVLLNDLQYFYKKLYEVCYDAENAHKDNFDSIVSNNNTKAKFISAFPLMLNKTADRTDRAYPGSLGFDTNTFPEIGLVEDFITAFLKATIFENKFENMKSSVDDSGNNNWLPINPIDSELNILNNGRNTESPYKNLTDVGSIMKQSLDRFYIASQYSYGNMFYNYGIDASSLNAFYGIGGLLIDITKFFVGKNRNRALASYLAESDAVNLVNSISDDNLLSSLQIQVQSWKTSIDDNNVSNNLKGFYDYLNANVPHYSNFNDQQDSFGNHLTLNDTKITKNRASSNFVGFELLDEDFQPHLRNETTSTSNNETDGQENIVDKFIDDVGNVGFFKRFFLDESGFDKLTKENVPYITDNAMSDDPFDSDFIHNNVKDDDIISTIRKHIQFKSISSGASADNTLKFLNDTSVTDDIKLYWLTREFCSVLSYFSQGGVFDPKINRKFIFPAMIEVPNVAHINMGILSYFWRNDVQTLSNETIASIEYTKKNYGSFSDYLLFEEDDDATNIKYISANDASMLIKYSTTFLNNSGSVSGQEGFGYIKGLIIDLINEVGALDINQTDYVVRGEEIDTRLKGESSNNGNNYKPLCDFLMKKLYLVNYSQFTFYPTKTTSNATNNFVPLVTLNANLNLKKFNDTYFKFFLNKVNNLCDDIKKQKSDNKNKISSLLNDDDIKNQTYYSFKSIADKWVTGIDKDGNLGNVNLINEFAFVDRFFNDIGDKVIIDFRSLIDMSKDYDVSVFSVMAKLLTLNGFEFFPVQNFLNFQQNEWIDSFKTYGSSRDLIKSQTPSFICMYIGGTSSQLDDPISGYEDDGVKDTQSLQQLPDTKNANVFGFKVSFGKQNQSMFKSIELSTNEHKETNESLAILSDIAQDQSASSPVPKGQNLFSTYEQRSYTCKVESLGNALIQPTQYFILENVPMFNGAYLILNIEHNIVQNSMKTKFDGVRIRSVPNPLVTNFYTATSPQSGNNVDSTDIVSPNFSDPNSNAFPSSVSLTDDLNNLKIKP